MTTLIVGCGYLGRRVARRLVARGERVLGTTRSASRAEELRAAGIEPVVLDVLDPGAVPAADRVFYNVGYDRSAGVPMREVYVEGLRRVLDRLGSRLVLASSTGVYGQDDGGWVDEDSRTEPRHEAGRVVLEAERLARAWGEARGLPVVVLRFAGLYGPGRVPRRAVVVGGEPIPGDPRRFLNLVHIDDAAEAAVEALERGAGGRVYLVADDRPVERGEFFGLAAAVLGAPAPRFEPGRAEAHGDSNKRVSNRRLREELGLALRYPDIQVGLPAALASEEA